MTNASDTSAGQGPRLAGMRGAGATLKTDDIANQVVTITDSVVVTRKDGSTTHKWVVEHEDGTIGLYWAPAQPAHQVQKWFRDYPGRPLRVMLHREGGEQGYPNWWLEQRELAAAPTPRPGDQAVERVSDDEPF